MNHFWKHPMTQYKALKQQCKHLLATIKPYLLMHLNWPSHGPLDPEQTTIRFWKMLFSHRYSERQLGQLTCQPEKVPELIKIPPMFNLKQVSVIEPVCYPNQSATSNQPDCAQVTVALILDYQHQTLECISVIKLRHTLNTWRIDLEECHQVLDLEAVLNAMLKIVSVGLNGELPADTPQEVSYPYHELRRMH